MIEQPQLSDIDWDYVKLQYEVLGYSLPAIAELHKIPEALLKYHSTKWTPINKELRKALGYAETDDYGHLINATEEQIQKEIESISLVKQRDIFRKYLELERILLNKSIKIAYGLPDDSSSINHVHNLLNTLHKLIEKNPMVNPSSTEEEDSSAGPAKVEVNIVHSATNTAEHTSEAGAVPDEEEKV